MPVVLCAALGAVAFGLSVGFGYPDSGSALLLSGLAVAVFSYVRSGALTPSWLRSMDVAAAKRVRWLELAKALLAAGIGVDFVGAWSFGFSYGFLGRSVITAALPVVVGLLSAIAAGVFLSRWFGAFFVGRD